MFYNIVCADPPWSFSDKLTMSDVKRGAASNYNTMTTQELCDLSVKEICANDALLALWVPGSLLLDGLKVMEAWGFNQKQIWCWVKTKKEPIKNLKKKIMKTLDLEYDLEQFDMNDTLGFGLGHLWRQTHEIVLIGTRGKINKQLLNKSQRSVFFSAPGKHSEKPEGLQDQLDIMFSGAKIELFARRNREGYTCIGNECIGFSYGKDIKDVLKEMIHEQSKNNTAA